MQHNYTHDVRNEFMRLLKDEKFTAVNREASMTGLVGNRTIEIVNASFVADADCLFGEVNHDYIAREEQWYESHSLNVNDIPGGAPAVWKSVADPDGFINSNYGWCIYSPDNGFNESHQAKPMLTRQSQFSEVVKELWSNPESRRAIMIYTRPTMWLDYNKNGRSDFMCTNTVQYLLRDGAIHAVVQMRSNDAIFGYKNDYAWQQHVLEEVTDELNSYNAQRIKSGLSSNLPYQVGKIHWNVGSLHVYARHFYLVDHAIKTGKKHITKEEYKKLYPDSPYI